MNDSITKLDVDILNMESEEISGSELGALKYVSELLDWDIKRTANLFILILIFVFDPLAITLVIATNQAFKGLRKDETNQTEPIIIEKIVEIPVEKIVEVPVKENEIPIEEYFENEDYHKIDKVEEVELENNIKEEEILPKRISYLNRNNNDGKSIRINRF
jgi:hypothetical protein